MEKVLAAACILGLNIILARSWMIRKEQSDEIGRLHDDVRLAVLANRDLAEKLDIYKKPEAQTTSATPGQV